VVSEGWGITVFGYKKKIGGLNGSNVWGFPVWWNGPFWGGKGREPSTKERNKMADTKKKVWGSFC